MFVKDSPYDDDVFIPQAQKIRQDITSSSNVNNKVNKPKRHSSSFLQRTTRCHASENSTFHVTSATSSNITHEPSTSDRVSLDYGQYLRENNNPQDTQVVKTTTNSRPPALKYGRLSSLSFNTFNDRLNRASSISNCSYNSQATLDSSLEQQQPHSFTNMIAKLASNTSATQKPTSSQMMMSAAAAATLQASNSVPLSSSQSKRKRSKLLDLLLNTNWSKQSQQASHLMKLNKVLLFCDANFLDEKSGESPLSLAITSPQINELQAATAKTSRLRLIGSNSHTMSSVNSASCPKSTSLFDLQNQHSTTSHSQLTLRQTSSVEISQSKAPLVERILLLLIKSGAIIDFRNSDGRTPLHVAATKSNFWALKTLLDLGASTDSRDTNGLTALFLSVLHKAELKVTQLLLNHINSSDSAGQTAAITNGDVRSTSSLSISDQHGWQAVHYAAKYGLSGHIEKLLYYGCDINAKITGSGNTPLHVAAINDQLQVAQILLLRGADRTITNNSHQNAHQVAVISNNMDLAEFIASHDETKVIPFKDKPQHNFASGHSSDQATAVNRVDNSNRSSISSAQQFLVKSAEPSAATNLISNNTTASNQSQAHYNTSTLRTGIVQPQLQEHFKQRNQQQLQSDHHHQHHHRLNPLSLDVANHYASSVSSSAPTTNTSGTSHQTARSSLLSIDTSSVQHNHLLNVQVNNISPCLSQRSCATSNTTTTSSSGVCCDGDGHNSEDMSNTRPDGRSNVTIISIANNSTTKYDPSIKYDYPQATNENGMASMPESDCTNSQQPPYSTRSMILSNGQISKVSGNINRGCGAIKGDDDAGSQSGSESSSSSDGLYSLMSDKKPLFVGSLVKATNCYESGDPRHLQLRRDDLVEIFECPADLIQDGQLPRLANKPMLYGRRQSDGMCGLFPSFCVRLSKHKLTASRRAMLDVTNLSGQQQQQQQQQQRLLSSTNERQQTSPAIYASKLPESQTMVAIGSSNSLQSSSAQFDSFDRHPESPKMSFRQFKVTLDKINEGFGFVLRGARIDPATFSPQSRGDASAKISIDENLMAANKLASLQYFSDIELNSIAHQSGLKRGDFLVSVNEHDVRLCSHEQVVHMIRQSGDRVQLTIARTEPIISSSDSVKTLTRVKPAPPKRDPNTTLTRNKASRTKSMYVTPQQQQQLYMRQNGDRFDADKPLPETPNMITSPAGLNRSVSTNLSHFNSANSLSSVAPDSQSVTSISTVDSSLLAPNSSSSTTTLTTVATTKPKTAPKPSDLYPKAPTTLKTSTDQAAYQHAAVITTNKRQPQDHTLPQAPRANNEVSAPISDTNNQQRAPQLATLPPPPPPPMPDFSGPLASERRDQRRTSAPVNQFTPLIKIDKNQLLKKRDSLACVPTDLGSSSSVTAAPICTVAAACAAAANNRLQRQQQQQQQQQQESEKIDDGQKARDSIDQENERVEVNATVAENDATSQNSCPEDSCLAESTEKTKEITGVQNEDTKPVEHFHRIVGRQPDEHRRHSNYLVTQSATLGRKSSAQIIQQPKPNSNPSHSQTLKMVTTKRMSILDHNLFPQSTAPATLPPPPMFAADSPVERGVNDQNFSAQHKQNQKHLNHHIHHEQQTIAEQHSGPLSERHLLNQMQLQNQRQMILRQQQYLRQQQQMQERIRIQQQQQQLQHQQQQQQKQQQQCPHHHHHHQRINHNHLAQGAQTLTRSDALSSHEHQQRYMQNHHNHGTCQHQSKHMSEAMTTPAMVQQRNQQFHDHHHQNLPNQHYPNSHRHLQHQQQLQSSDSQRAVAGQQYHLDQHNHHQVHYHHNHNHHQVQGLQQYQLQPIDPRLAQFDRQRTTFTQQQLDYLTESFMLNNYPEARDRNKLAAITKLDPSRIQVWFQNQRAKQKKGRGGFSSGSGGDDDDQHQHHHHHHHHHALYNQPLHHLLSNSGAQQSPQQLPQQSPQQSPQRIYVFDSRLANEAAQAVADGRVRSIIEYHDLIYAPSSTEP